MKNNRLYLAIASTIAIFNLTISNAHAQATRFIDVIGNPPYGADPVNGVVGGGATPTSSPATFASGVQEKVNAVSANLTASAISGSQTVAGNTVEVDPAAATTALELVNSPLDSNPPARAAFVVALGGGIPAQQLAQSMIGLRAANGSIDPVLFNAAVSAYNNYIRSYIATSQVTQRSTSDLDTVVRSLPPGQKAAQVLLGKLIEAAQ
jgi:hypothetical protein